MRTSRVAGAAVVAAVLLALSGICARAGDMGVLEVMPNPAHPCSTVNLTSSECGRDGSAVICAQVLGYGTVCLSSRGQTHPENAQGTLRVPTSIKPDPYGFGSKCANGREIRATP
ncbi:hypothetical protein ACFV2N_22540 [Streptomyces sp. NPDC059680]|uniref:hypothetical protein n=1 Tax=Streptomyces sp. NPDC059680 TaxID=3346904 RepID=UPI0036797CAE